MFKYFIKRLIKNLIGIGGILLYLLAIVAGIISIVVLFPNPFIFVPAIFAYIVIIVALSATIGQTIDRLS